MGTYGYIKHSELSHHGIKGQRWGVRNGPPYPLSESDRSTKERKSNPPSKSGSRLASRNNDLTKFTATHISGKNKYAQNNIANIFKGTPENAAMKNTPGGKQWTTNKEVGKTVAKSYAKEFAGKGSYKKASKEMVKWAAPVVSGNRKDRVVELLEGVGKESLKYGSRLASGHKTNVKASNRTQEKELNNYIKSFETKKSPYVDKAFIFDKKIKDGPTMRLYTHQDNNKTANEKFKAAKEFETNFKSIKKELDKAIIPVMKKEGLDDSSINKLLSRMDNAFVDTNFDGNEVTITTGYSTSGTGLPFGNNSFYVYYDPKRKKVTGAELGD